MTIIEQTKLLNKKQVKKVRKEFNKQKNIIKGSSFLDLLDNIDKHEKIIN